MTPIQWIAVACALTLSTTLAAQEPTHRWSLVRSGNLVGDNELASYYMDKLNVIRSGPRRQVWMRMVTVTNDSVHTPTSTEQHYQVIVNCSTDQFRTAPKGLTTDDPTWVDISLDPANMWRRVETYACARTK